MASTTVPLSSNSSAGNPIEVSASLAPLARCRPSLADTKALRARWERNSFSASTRSFSIGPRLWSRSTLKTM
nr:hypothetical protein [Bradyrhizobium sp. AUGA SZCCT0283]